MAQVIEKLKCENAQLKKELERLMNPASVNVNTPCSKPTLTRESSSGDNCTFLTPSDENCVVNNTSLPLIYDLHSDNQGEHHGDSGSQSTCSISNQDTVPIIATAGLST